MKCSKQILIIISILLFTSCSVFDNKSNTQQVDNVELSSVNEAYDGIDELMGKDLGVIKLPDRINAQDTSDVYTFSARIHQPVAAEENKEYAINLYSDFFGNSFDKNKCGFDDLQYYYLYTEDGKELARYADGMISLVKNDYEISDDSVIQKRYNADSTEQIKIGNDICSISDISGYAKSFLDAELPDLYDGFTIEPYDVFTRKNSDTDIALINCTQSYHGIPFEDYPTNYSVISKDNSGNDLITSYYATDIRMTMNAKNSIAWVHIDNPVEITQTEKLDKMISLKSAIEILQNELSSLSKYNFDEIKLMYCSKQTYINYDYSQMTLEEQLEKSKELNNTEYEFYPTWCFISNNELSGYSRWIVKLNAITGEITIDAPDGVAGQKGS